MSSSMTKSGMKSGSSKRGVGKAKKKNNSGRQHQQQQGGLKVVHISNPMKVEVSPDEFRSLVQELTGRHAVEWPDHPRWRKTSPAFTLDNVTNHNQVLAEADRNETHQAEAEAEAEAGVGVEVEEEEEEEEEFHLDHIAFGSRQPLISCYFGSDDLLFNSHHHDDDLLFSFLNH